MEVLFLLLLLLPILTWLLFKLQKMFFILWTKIDPEDTRHGGLLVAEVLKDHGVTNIFTLIGGHISPIVVAAEALGIRVVDTRHEVTAVFAADAYARLSGVVGVAAVTAGPGVTNTITAVKNAQMAETPLLVLGGAAATLLKGRGALQDIDQLSLFKSVCKYTKSVSCVRDIIPTLRKAIQIAFSSTPGPVFVELPINVLYPYKLVQREMKIQKAPKGFITKLSNQFLKSYLHYQFANGFTFQDTYPLHVNYPLASNSIIEQCEHILLQCKRPLILLGSQALIPPKYAMELKKSIEVLNIPCYLGGMARGLLGRNSPLHMRQRRREALQEADLILLVGTVCDFRLSYGQIFNKKSKVISVNMDERQLKKNSGIFWSPTLAVKALPADFIIRLASRTTQYSFQESWISNLRERDMETEDDYKNKAKVRNDSALNPVDFLFQLEEALPDKTILIADGGDFAATSSYILKSRGPLMWLDPGAFGTLGVGAGFALGAKLCFPDSTVVIIYGDGSCGYSIVEFDTFVRHKIPVLAVVGNDACWSQIAREQVPMFQSDIACNLSYTDYHKVVEGFGASGYLINTQSDFCLSNIIDCALHDPVLVNVHIGRSDFRAGSISI